MTRGGLLLVALAACGGDGRKPTEPVVATADAAAAVDAAGPATPDPALVRELGALGEDRQRELGTEVAAVDETDRIRAIPACAPPGAAATAAMGRRIDAWVKRRVPGSRRQPDGNESKRFGCAEPGGVVVEVHVDLMRGRFSGGYSWVLRVTPRSIAVLGEASGCSSLDCMEYDVARSVHTMALVDLDGDGRREAVTMRGDHEVGAVEGDDEILVEGAVVGHVNGTVEVASEQPPPGEHTLVLAIRDIVEGREAGPVFRCVTPWTVCPAGEAIAQRGRARRAAAELVEKPDELMQDRGRLAEALTAAGIPDATQARFVAAAAPGSLPSVVERYLRSRDAVRLALTYAEGEAATRQLADQHAVELRDALGNQPCPAADWRTVEGPVKAWLARHEPGATELMHGSSCAGAAGSYWSVTWRVSSGAREVQRGAVFHAAGELTLLADGTSKLDSYQGERPSAVEPEKLPDAVFFRQGDAIGALVRHPGHGLVAAFDGVVTGRRAGDADLEVRTHEPIGMLFITGSGLATSRANDRVTFLAATPQGVSVVADVDARSLAAPGGPSSALATRLVSYQRRFRADAMLRRAGAPVRADVLAALEALDAPAAVLDEARAAP